VQESLMSVGFIIGSLCMARASERLREGQWIAMGLLGMGLVEIGYSSMRAVAPAIALLAISGLLNALPSIARRLVIQRYTPREMRGRVNSALFVWRDVLSLLGMAAAGLADVFPIRLMYLATALMLLAAGAWASSMPGFGQPAAEWKRALELLRKAPAEAAPRLALPATLADVDALVGLLPALGALDATERQTLVNSAAVSEAPAGVTIVRHGEKADKVYFVLAGKAVAGVAAEGGYRSLSTLRPGDFFGEIAALSGEPRTANVVTEEPTTLLSVPAPILRDWMDNPTLHHLFLSTAAERLGRTNDADWPRLAGLDQQALRELREKPALEGKLG
jgi:CRP-like cAMP-binding protein